MELELAKVSEKGQIVIPNSLRKGMGIKKSDQFLIFGEGDIPVSVSDYSISVSVSKTLVQNT